MTTKSNKTNSVKETSNKFNELLKVSEAKKAVKTAFEKEFLTAFACLHWSNKHKKESGFSDLYTRFGITKDNGELRDLTLNDLLNVLPDGETDDKKRIFCKLSSSDKNGVSIRNFVDKNDKVWYYIPIKNSTNEFFSSVKAKKDLNTKEFLKAEFEKNADARRKREEQKTKKLTEKVNELKADATYKGLTDEQINAIAKAILKF